MKYCYKHRKDHVEDKCPICESNEAMKKIVNKKSKKESKTVYICKTDWDWEVGEASDLEGKMPMYSDLEKLKKERPCWDSCGVLQLKVTEVKKVIPDKPWSKL